MLKIRLFPILILMLGLVFTFVITYSDFLDNKRLRNHDFESVCHSFESKILIQLKANAQVLYSSAAFISSSDTITREEWKEFQYLNKSFTELPGIRGIGFLAVIPAKHLSEFEQRIRKEGFPEFKVYPQGIRDFYTSVIYLEPLAGRNLLALGYDGYSDPIRQKAMVLSRDNDKAMISDKVFLIQEVEAQKSAGTLMFVPVFKRGSLEPSIDERKSSIMGWVFCPFDMDDLLKGILGEWDFEAMRLSVYDENLLVPEKLLFDSDLAFNIQHDALPKAECRVPMDFNGKVWTLHFTSYYHNNQLFTGGVALVLFLGFLISVLLFVLAISFINARAKSVKIQKLNEELKKVNINKDRFISILAHDLKSPFNTLLGFSELLSENLDKLKKQEVEDYINQIYTSAQLTYLLLDELLLWARVQSDHFPYKPERMNVVELCRVLIDDHALISGKKNITVYLDESEAVFVLADELMLKTILRNLLVNAIKFTPESGSIHFKLSKTENKVIVSVIDNGVGMPTEKIEKLFDISTIKSTSGTANEKGTGLGLLLCKDLVEKHGGQIWVESSPGKGSQFKFSLPVA
ncbi:MAG: CHASE domain-containing protein [Prolixibacteraceae bacterium]|nr:CHASE domain-containing protein [Prolixibacteraceae bacterium]